MLENCILTVKGDVLTVTVNLSQSGRPSRNRRGRKNKVIGTSNGTITLVNADGSYRSESLNMSVWRPATPEEAANAELWEQDSW